MSFAAGHALVDITPRSGCDLCGFAAREQPSTGIGGRLSAHVLTLREGRVGAVIAVCDLLGFTIEDSIQLESLIAKAAGVPAKNVLLACTHTHSGPMSRPIGLAGRFDPAYVRTVGERLAAAAAEARADAAPVEGLRIGARAIPSLGRFRCAVDEPGRDRWPGILTVVQIVRQDRPPLTLVHAGLHPLMLGPASRVVHPDFPGEWRRLLGRETGGPVVFLPGCGADAHPVPAMQTSLRAIREFAAKLTAESLKALERAKPLADGPLRATLVSPRVRFGFTVPTRAPSARPEAAQAALSPVRELVRRNTLEWQAHTRAGVCPRAMSFRTHLLRLGGLVFAGMPAEVFCDTGLDLARSVPGRWLLTIAQAGGDVGYLPRPFAYRRRTYEAASAHEWYRTAGAMLPGTERAVRKRVAAAVRGL